MESNPSSKHRMVYLVGVGMGNPDSMTQEARKTVESCQAILGSQRVTNLFSHLPVPRAAAFDPDAICDYLTDHPEYVRVAVLFSGDTGFYSGAKLLRQRLQTIPGVTAVSLCGVSSLAYFCAKLETSWDDVHVISLHGRTGSLPSAVASHKKTFVLTGGRETVPALCLDLTAHGLGGVLVSVGERLSYPEERIVTARAADLAAQTFDNLSVLLIENPEAQTICRATHGLDDSVFLRGNIPMTKSEVRSVSLSKLQLQDYETVYDIGAGTGSVAVEMALCLPSGSVYAIERNPEAVALIQANREKFRLHNLEITIGTAPQAFASLPAPDRAFIGGSGGQMQEILSALLCKNPSIRVVLNAITLETVGEALQSLQACGFQEIDIVHLAVSKAKQMGSYHMMTAQNPVYILSANGPGEEAFL